MKKNIDVIIIGFALFSMFFGAGNLIFPSYIGVSSGSNWLISFLGFIIADVGIILLSINAIAKAGSFQGVVQKAGKKFGLILETIMMLCLGPILVIPRTGATTFEMSILPLNNSFNPVLFSILFFALVLVLTIKPSKVMDIIGKFLTPVLLIALAFLIIKGIVSPIGIPNSSTDSNNFFMTGITQGYQTMDALGLGGVTALIMSSFLSKGYSDKKDNISLTIKASCIAGFGLTLVYGGLAYLGATVSNIYNPSISQTTLLVNLTNLLLGNAGTVLLSIIVAFACLTTSVGLTSVTAKYFEDITNKKLKYEYLVIFICIFSAIVSNLGVDKIIDIAAPVLTVLYPVSIVLVLMSSLQVIKSESVFKGSAYATLLVSTLTLINSLGLGFEFVNKLPFANLGFNWVIPAIFGGFVCYLSTKYKQKMKKPKFNSCK